MRIHTCMLFGACLVAGCAATTGPDVRDQMVGMSEEQLNRCLGPPATKRAQGATDVWAYFADSGGQASPAEASLPLMPSNQPTEMGGHTCQILIKLEGGKVMTVDYESLISDRDDHECADTVQRCAR